MVLEDIVDAASGFFTVVDAASRLVEFGPRAEGLEVGNAVFLTVVGGAVVDLAVGLGGPVEVLIFRARTSAEIDALAFTEIGLAGLSAGAGESCPIGDMRSAGTADGPSSVCSCVLVEG